MKKQDTRKEFNLNKLYNIDCMKALPQIPDKFFDLAIVDPPYGISLDRNIGRRKGQKQSSYKKITWDNAPPDRSYFDELFRVSKNQIIWGGNYFNLPPSRGIVCWDKRQPCPGFSQVEIAWTSFNRPAALYRQSSRGGSNKIRIHPTQKPVELYLYLLENYAKRGDKILDTHAGSASSLIACAILKYDFLAFEIDKDYYDAAVKRIQIETAQLRLEI